ncbi:hypothetical protein FRC09_003269 [Ceratobasidium sp. 395]|nr:hypothetical protein FRC09_003269 [Ceratobasidium sp. 395]
MNMTCSANDLVDMCTVVTSNPDISGIGVRTAIYTQTFLNIVSSSFMPNNNIAFRDTSRNTYVLSFSLILSSLIQSNHGGLSLFDGIISTVLTTLMTVFVTVNYQYIRTLGLSIQVASLLFTSFWCYWGLQVWSHSVTFGLEPAPPVESNITSNIFPTTLSIASRSLDPSIANCTANADTVYVVFGRSISATNQGLRIWALVVFSVWSLLTLVAAYDVLREAILYVKYGADWVKEARIEQTVNEEIYGDDIGIGHGGGGKTRVAFLGGTRGLASLGVLAYMIITTEQIVQRNPSVHDDLSKWTFGQTLGLIMLGQQITDIGHWVIRREILRRGDR